MLDEFSSGLLVALSPESLLYCLIGVTLGTAIGLLPGLGSATGVALMFPLIATLNDPLLALIMLAGLYYGSQYGSTISSVLLATPGETTSIVTVYDGYPLARAGRAGATLGVAAVASFVAGTISTGLLMATAPTLSDVALNFGPPENLALLILALLTVAGVGQGSLVKGLAMCFFGLSIATVGFDLQTGTARFTFGNIELFGGFGIIEVLIGVFALGEVIRQSGQELPDAVRTRFRDMWPSRSELKRTVGPTLRGTGLGFGMGALPGVGPTLASFAAYEVERKVSREPQKFGSGMIEGVAGPEAANNAAANGAFVPMLTLGLPGSGTTAVLLGAFVVLGVQPGPLLMDNESDLVWALLASFLVGNLMLLVLNLPLAPAFASLLRVPYSFLYPVIVAVALVGAYSVENRTWGIGVAVVFGLLGYFAASLDYPLAPFVLGFILGEPLEQQLSRTLAMGHGDILIIAERPIALALMILTVLILTAPLVRRGRRRRRSLPEMNPTRR